MGLGIQINCQYWTILFKKKLVEVKHQLQFTVIAKHCFPRLHVKKHNQCPYMLSVVQMN